MSRPSALIVVVLLSAVIGTPPASGASFTAEKSLEGNTVTTGVVSPPANFSVDNTASSCPVHVSWGILNTNGRAPSYNLTRHNPDGTEVAIPFRDLGFGRFSALDFVPRSPQLNWSYTFEYTLTSAIGGWTTSMSTSVNPVFCYRE